MGLFSKSKDHGGAAKAGKKLARQKPPSERPTALHWFYTIVWNGGGALIIAGGANFGIATGTLQYVRLLDAFKTCESSRLSQAPGASAFTP